MKTSYITLTLIAAAAIMLFAFTGKNDKQSAIYSFKLKTLDGKETTLAPYKGKKLLLVNVASECGYTPQYKNLQALSEKYKGKLVVIGFPANNFGGQEPGSSLDIKSFCTKNYGVTFPMMEKISVKGDDTHALYKWLSNKAEDGVTDEAPKWNFCKYLIDENGKIIKFFSSKTDPLSEEITSLL
jgi:glutathione peroxidase